MSTRKKVILITTGLLVVGGVVAGVVFWPQISEFTRSIFQKDESVVVGETPKTGLASAESVALYEEALAVAEESGPAAAQQVFDDKLQTTTDDQQKSDIYIQKATLAGSATGGSNLAQALEYAYDGEEVSPTYATAILIASLEEQLGNKANALKYYKLYLDRLTDEANQLNPGDKDAYTRKVQQLEAELGL